MKEKGKEEIKGSQETREKAKKQEGKGEGGRARKKEERVGMSREKERGAKGILQALTYLG